MTNETTLKIMTPVQVTKYATSDGKVHHTELDALAHETFLAARNDLDGIRKSGRFRHPDPANIAYEIITTLAKKYHFTPRDAV